MIYMKNILKGKSGMNTHNCINCVFVYMSNLQGIMLVYDITNEKSFENIQNWIRNIDEVTICLFFVAYNYKCVQYTSWPQQYKM